MSDSAISLQLPHCEKVRFRSQEMLASGLTLIKMERTAATHLEAAALVLLQFFHLIFNFYVLISMRSFEIK